MPLSCRLCHGVVLAPRLQFPGMTLSLCKGCGFQQIDPEPSAADLRRIYGAAYFGKAKYSDQTALGREYDRRRTLIASAGLRLGADVLEIGCGTGDFLTLIAPKFAMRGIDISDEAIAIAKSRLPHLAHCLTAARIEDYAPDPTGYDAILLWDLIEHLWDGPEALRRIATWLRPGGRLLLSTPDVGSLFSHLLGRRWPFMTPPEHLCFFSHRTIQRLANEAGLEVVSIASKGKWTNVAFAIYKAGRVGLLPHGAVKSLNALGLRRLSIYVPTQDVLYASLRRGG